MSAADVAAVIVSYRTGAVLFEALEAILADPTVAEVVLVDNGNPPETERRVDALVAAGRRLAVVRGQGNVGFARACNLGAGRARSTHLFFLNPDARIEPGAVEALRFAGQGARSPWITGARIVDPSGREQRGGRRGTPRLGQVCAAALGLGPDRVHLEDAPLPKGPAPVGAVSGAAMMMRAADYHALGGFDERYFLHAEDLDICRRALGAGGEVIFVPAAQVVHVGGTSAASPLLVEWCKGRGLARYFVTFAAGPGEKIAAIALGPLIVLAALGRGVLRRRRREPA